HSLPPTSFLNLTLEVIRQLPSSISGDDCVSNPSSVGCTKPLCAHSDAPCIAGVPIGVLGNSILPIKRIASTSIGQPSRVFQAMGAKDDGSVPFDFLPPACYSLPTGELPGSSRS